MPVSSYAYQLDLIKFLIFQLSSQHPITVESLDRTKHLRKCMYFSRLALNFGGNSLFFFSSLPFSISCLSFLSSCLPACLSFWIIAALSYVSLSWARNSDSTIENNSVALSYKWHTCWRNTCISAWDCPRIHAAALSITAKELPTTQLYRTMDE